MASMFYIKSLNISMYIPNVLELSLPIEKVKTKMTLLLPHSFCVQPCSR